MMTARMPQWFGERTWCPQTLGEYLAALQQIGDRFGKTSCLGGKAGFQLQKEYEYGYSCVLDVIYIAEENSIAVWDGDGFPSLEKVTLVVEQLVQLGERLKVPQCVIPADWGTAA